MLKATCKEVQEVLAQRSHVFEIYEDSEGRAAVRFAGEKGFRKRMQSRVCCGIVVDRGCWEPRVGAVSRRGMSECLASAEPRDAHEAPRFLPHHSHYRLVVSTSATAESSDGGELEEAKISRCALPALTAAEEVPPLRPDQAGGWGLLHQGTQRCA